MLTDFWWFVCRILRAKYVIFCHSSHLYYCFCIICFKCTMLCFMILCSHFRISCVLVVCIICISLWKFLLLSEFLVFEVSGSRFIVFFLLFAFSILLPVIVWRASFLALFHSHMFPSPDTHCDSTMCFTCGLLPALP